jgi:hypothetical protein
MLIPSPMGTQSGTGVPPVFSVSSDTGGTPVPLGLHWTSNAGSRGVPTACNAERVLFASSKSKKSEYTFAECARY